MSRRPATFQTPPPSGASPIQNKPIRYTDLYNQDTLRNTPYHQRPTVHSLATIPSDTNENADLENDENESVASIDLTTGHAKSTDDVKDATIESTHEVSANETPADFIEDRVKIADQSAISNLILSPDSTRHALSDEDYYSSDSLVTEKTEPDTTKIDIPVIQETVHKTRSPPPSVAPKNKSYKLPLANKKPPELIPLQVIPQKEISLRHHVSDPGPPPGHLEPETDTSFAFPSSSPDYNPLTRPLTATELDLMDKTSANVDQANVMSPQINSPMNLSRHISDSSRKSSISYRGGEEYATRDRPGDESLSSSMRNLHRGGAELSLSPSIRSLPLSRPNSMRSLNRTPGSSDSTLNDREIILESYLEHERKLIPIYDPDMAGSEIDIRENEGFIPEPDSPKSVQPTQRADSMLKIQNKFVPEPEPVEYDPTEIPRRPSLVESGQGGFVPEPAELNTTVSQPPNIVQSPETVRRPSTGRRRGKIIAIGTSTALFLVAITIGVAVYFAYFPGSSAGQFHFDS
ncbi:uncharacterized protein [Amphiura filiformis]|uniref:uncharacterized protein isoform X2 n=1 Tax=Amphiura filiformis TaxID=82378 RepID=UPI003B2187DC